MAKHVFYSFHYLPDCSRVSQVRNIGAIDDNKPAHDNEWEQIKKGGPPVIKKWIDGQLNGRSCTVVMIGASTAGREWINYEIRTSWNFGKGIVGVHIHNLQNFQRQYSTKGRNPFEHTWVGATRLDTIVKTYDPPGGDSKQVYAHIAANLSAWIDEATRTRKNWN